jgi:phage-related protein
MSNVPNAHIDDATRLQADGMVEFFQFDLTSGSSVYLKNENTVLWNGNQWEGVAIKISGVGSYSDDQIAKPKITFQNPDAIFSPFAAQGVFTAGFMTRYRVAYDDVINNNPVYVNQVWQIGRVSALTRSLITLELRSLTDVPNFIIPARTYQPPEFPSVSVN